MNEDIDEDYLDDPIRLFDFEQSRVCFSEFSKNSFEDPGFIIDISNDETTEYNFISSYRKGPSMVPVTFLNVERNVKLLSECRPLCIKLIDCEKYPNFYKEDKVVKQYGNAINLNELSSEEVILIDENESKKIFNKNTENAKSIRHSVSPIKYTEDGKNIIVSNEKDSEFTQCESFHSLDMYARTVDKAYQTLKKGSCSPILPCPLKSNNKTVQVTPNISPSFSHQHKNSNINCTKKIFSNKRVIPHYHEETRSNNINSKHIKTLSDNKKEDYGTCRINNFTNKKKSANIPSLKECKISNTNLSNNSNIKNKNILLLNSLTTNICQLPCCLTQVGRDIANVKNNEIISMKDINDKQFMMTNLKESNKTLMHKKNHILLNQKPQVVNHINNNFQYYPIQPIIPSHPTNYYYYSIPQNSIKSSAEHQISNNLCLLDSNSGAKFQTFAANTQSIKLLHPNMLPHLTQNEIINFRPKIPNKKNGKLVSDNSKTVSIANNGLEISTVEKNRSENINNLIYLPNANSKPVITNKTSIDSRNKNISKRYTPLVQPLECPIEMNTHIPYSQYEQQKTHNNKQACDSSRQFNSASKGYSPPILPIPTYQKTFEVLSKIQYNYFQRIKSNKDLNFDQTPTPNLTRKRKVNDNKEKVARKISIIEYKKRLDLPNSGHNGKIKMANEVSSKEIVTEDLDATVLID